MTLPGIRRSLACLLLVGLNPCGVAVTRGQAVPAESNYVKLLKKAPEARLGAIIGVIGNRGDAGDLGYLLDRIAAPAPGGFPPGPRRAALEALAEAGSTRALRPTEGLDRLNLLIAGSPDLDPATRLAAVRLAQVWRLPSSVPALVDLAAARPGADSTLRDAAIDALAGTDAVAARLALVTFVARRTDAPDLQRAALIAMVRLDLGFAANRAVGMIAGSRPDDNLAPLLAAFLNQQGGAERLVAAIEASPPGPDGAKLALRGLATLGRTDDGLVAALSRIGGVQVDPQAPNPAEMARLVADVASQGDPARGERIFRRVEINCMKCHAVAGAGGGIGPDLSALGSSSPVDYIVNSILIPDQAIKEEYQTRIISTTDGLVLQGIVAEEDDRQVVLKDAQGEKRVVARAAIEETKRGGSLMPKGLVGPLTRAEFVDLVRFLAELGKPGPYAIRPTPTIQRWRALRPTPAALIGTASPSPATLRSDVLDAEPAALVPAYAWVSGDLPLAEVAAAAGGPVGIVVGEITVSTAGPVGFRFGSQSGPRLAAWVDAEPLKVPPDGIATALLGAGTRKLTIRVEPDAEHSSGGSLHVEVIRIAGSPAEFSVVGGP